MNHLRRVTSLVLALLLCTSCKETPQSRSQNTDQSNILTKSESADFLRMNVTGKHGGKIVSCFLNDPSSFHPLQATDTELQTINQLVNPGLTRLNLATQEIEPALAKSWEASADQLTWTFHLRRGVTWPDGSPFTSRDVLFTAMAAADPELRSPAFDALKISGQQIQWKEIDMYTVEAKLPAIFAPFLRKLDGVTFPIVSQQKWGQVYRDHKFQAAMRPSMNLNDHVSLGPFCLKDYKPGQYLTFKRNPRYWKLDRNGNRLPFLDEIVFMIVPDLNQIELRLESGLLDTFYSVLPKDLDSFKRKAEAANMRLYNVGPTFDFEGLFFNQNAGFNPGTNKPYLSTVKRSWFADLNFRKALSFAIDRERIVQTALAGQGIPAFGPESVGNRSWFNRNIHQYPYNLQKAKQLLLDSSFVFKTDPAGQPVLYDRNGNRVRFSLFTNAGNRVREAQCRDIGSDLLKLGIQVDYSPMEFGSLISRITHTFDYDSALLGMSREGDPSGAMNIWPSFGSAHFWWPKQKQPATSWEKEIDELMILQFGTFDQKKRKAYYDRVQSILSDQLPMIFTVNEIIWACAKKDIGNLKPVVSRHRTLWNGEELFRNHS